LTRRPTLNGQSKKKHKLHVPNPLLQKRTPVSNTTLSAASLYRHKGFASTRNLALKKSIIENKCVPLQNFGETLLSNFLPPYSDKSGG